MNDAIELLEGLDPEVGRTQFKLARMALRKSQAAVARDAGYSESYVTRLEGGSWWPKVMGGWWTLEAFISEGLGLPVADFVAQCQRGE